MKLLSESKAIEKLAAIRREFRDVIRREFEHRAKSCATCETPGACCLDVHFVNVRVTRLEAVAIKNALAELPNGLRENVFERIGAAIDVYSLDQSDASQTYSCPLFEKGIGCLVHSTAKPLPCIAHACYERKDDLPPEELLTEREIEIEGLNRRVYGKTVLLPLPIAIR